MDNPIHIQVEIIKLRNLKKVVFVINITLFLDVWRLKEAALWSSSTLLLASGLVTQWRG